MFVRSGNAIRSSVMYPKMFKACSFSDTVAHNCFKFNYGRDVYGYTHPKFTNSAPVILSYDPRTVDYPFGSSKKNTDGDYTSSELVNGDASMMPLCYKKYSRNSE